MTEGWVTQTHPEMGHTLLDYVYNAIILIPFYKDSLKSFEITYSH